MLRGVHCDIVVRARFLPIGVHSMPRDSARLTIMLACPMLIVVLSLASTLRAQTTQPARPPQPQVVPPAVAPAPAPAPAAAPEAGAPGAPAEQPPVKIRVLPQSVNFNGSISFDENGRPQNENQNLSLSLSLFTEGKTNITVCRNMTIERIITDRGELLRVDPNNLAREFGMGRDPFQRQMMGGMRNRMGMSLSLPVPTRPAQRIAEITGSIEVEYTSGPAKQAVIENIKDLEGKRIRIAELADSVVIITRPDRQSTRIELSSRLWGQLSSVRFYDENNRELNFQGWTDGGSNGKMQYRVLRLAIPDAGKAVLEFFPEVKTFRLPFNVKNIPLPTTGQSESVDVVIEATDPKPMNIGVAPIERVKVQPEVAELGG